MNRAIQCGGCGLLAADTPLARAMGYCPACDALRERHAIAFVRSALGGVDRVDDVSRRRAIQERLARAAYEHADAMMRARVGGAALLDAPAKGCTDPECPDYAGHAYDREASR